MSREIIQIFPTDHPSVSLQLVTHHHNKRVTHSISRQITRDGFTTLSIMEDIKTWSRVDMPRYNAKKMSELHDTFTKEVSIPEWQRWALDITDRS